MIKFIVAEENNKIGAQIQAVIMDVMQSDSFPFEIIFIHHSGELKSYLDDDVKKIFILDTSFHDENVVGLIKQIREEDFASFILLISYREESQVEYLKPGFLIFDYISLLKNPWRHLELDLVVILRSALEKQMLCITMKQVTYRIPFEDILYITKELASRSVVIVTKNISYICNLPLYQIASKLQGNFVYSHRSCIVNVDQIVKIDSNENLIYFEGGKSIFASRRYIKNVLEKFPVHQ